MTVISRIPPWLKGWAVTSLFIGILLYAVLSQQGGQQEMVVVEGPTMFVFPDTPPGVMEIQRRAALEQFPGLETERVFTAFTSVPEFRHMLRTYGVVQAMPHMLKCMEGVAEETTDQEAQEKALCAWRVVKLVSAGPLSQSLLASNPRIAIQAYGLYGHTKEWEQVVNNNNPPFVNAVLAKCLEGKGDRLFDLEQAAKTAFRSVVVDKTMPAPAKKLTPVQCGWYAIGDMVKMGPAFFTGFVMNEKGEAVRAKLGAAAAWAREVFLGNLFEADKKNSLDTLTAGDVGWAALDAAGLVAIFKLPGLALKAATLGGAAKATAVAGAGAVGKVGFIVAAPFIGPAMMVGGGAYLVTHHPEKVGEYIGKPLAYVFNIPDAFSGILGWAIVAFLFMPLWLPLLRFGWRRIQHYRFSRSS